MSTTDLPASYAEMRDRLAEEADLHLYLRNPRGLCQAIRTLTTTDDLSPLPGTQTIRPFLDRGETPQWRMSEPAGGPMPAYLFRAVTEAVSGDLAVNIPEGRNAEERAVIYRRDIPKRITRDIPVSWHPIASLASEYGGKGADVDPAADDWFKDALRLQGQTIRRAMCFRNTDGTRLEYEYVRSRGWVEYGITPDGAVARASGSDRPPVAKSDYTPDPGYISRPCVYTQETGMTLADARAAAGRASDVLRLWCTDPDGHGTVDEDSYGNALLASAACFMRSHPEQAYVFMGAGGGGKSSFIKALMDHLDRRAMTFAPELLTQPTAMSAENAMLNLSSHLVAVSDDFTPGPKWQDILNMLKTLLTGLLPFSARRRGEDSVEGLRPLAVHIFTTNDHLPIGDSEAEQRRFAFAVFRNPEGYARFTDFSRDGAVFWPFMMASAMGWVRFAGRHHKGGNWINVEALSDAQVEAVRRVIQDGYVVPAPGVRIGWKGIGLVRSSRRIAGDDGDPRTVTVYAPPVEGNTLEGTWKACRAAVAAMDARRIAGDLTDRGDVPPLSSMLEPPRMELNPKPVEDAPAEGDVTDQGLSRAEGFKDLSYVDDMDTNDSRAIMEILGIDGDTFPLKGGDDYSQAKRPMVASWSDCLTEAPGISGDSDAPVLGFCPADGWMIVDMDLPHAEDKDKPNGLELLHGTVGRFGDPDGLGEPAIVVSTPSGGLHAYYRIPADLRLDPETPWREVLKNRAHPMKGKPAYDGGPSYIGGLPVDVRVGRAGYAVMPGSRLPDGRAWEIVRNSNRRLNHDAPRALLARLGDWGFITDKAAGWAHPAMPAPTGAGRRDLFAGLLGGDGQPDLSPVAEGSRNDTIHAQCYGRHANHPDECARIDRETMERAAASGLPEEEARSIIRSVHRALGIA